MVWPCVSRSSERSLIVSTATLLLVSWLSLIEAKLSASDYYVHSLPGAPKGPLLDMHAGHVEVSPKHNGALFFWHFANKHTDNRQRTVIWLNGGPGCSSMDGALMEVGPYRVREGGQLEYNNGSWDEFANLMFVDNPAGTGFSYINGNAYLKELEEMADQFVVFLENWFMLFPEHEQNDLYLAGESYAGQHIPYIAREILKKKHNKWNLKGLLIGNGWIGPDQYPSYLKFSYERGIIEPRSKASDTMENVQKKCEQKLAGNTADHVDIPECEAILQDLLQVTQNKTAPQDQRCINMYDVRLSDSYPSCGMNWPPDLDTVTPYLRRDDVLTALNIDRGKKSTGWHECDGQVSGAFRARNSKPSVDLLPDLLEQIPIVLFSGADDLICNHYGTEALIHRLEWNGGQGFEDPKTNETAPKRPWTFDGENVGLYQEARNLTYVLFYNSSHMVPFDHARRSRAMLDRFMGINLEDFPDQNVEDTLGDAQPAADDEKEATETTSSGSSKPTGKPNKNNKHNGNQNKGNKDANKTASSEDSEMTEEEKLEQAKWSAYYRSGEVALVVVVIGAALFGWYVYRDRKKRAGYQGVSGNEDGEGPSIGQVIDGARNMEPFRHQGEKDLEAADFDENQLDRLKERDGGRGGERYSLASSTSDESDVSLTREEASNEEHRR